MAQSVRMRIERDGTTVPDSQAGNVTATQPAVAWEKPDLEELLGRELDAVSFQHLEASYPTLAGALQEVVTNGYTPQQVRQYLMQRGMPLAWARWLEQAARYLRAAGE